MKREDIEKLLGGYAAGNLTSEEQRELFEAALEDQDLFEQLMQEEALRETLADPAARRRLLEATEPRRGWFQRPFTWAIAGSLAAAFACAVFVVRLASPPSQQTKQVAMQKVEQRTEPKAEQPAAAAMTQSQAEAVNKPVPERRAVSQPAEEPAATLPSAAQPSPSPPVAGGPTAAQPAAAPPAAPQPAFARPAAGQPSPAPPVAGGPTAAQPAAAPPAAPQPAFARPAAAQPSPAAPVAGPPAETATKKKEEGPAPALRERLEVAAAPPATPGVTAGKPAVATEARQARPKAAGSGGGAAGFVARPPAAAAPVRYRIQRQLSGGGWEDLPARAALAPSDTIRLNLHALTSGMLVIQSADLEPLTPPSLRIEEGNDYVLGPWRFPNQTGEKRIILSMVDPRATLNRLTARADAAAQAVTSRAGEIADRPSPAPVVIALPYPAAR